MNLNTFRNSKKALIPAIAVALLLAITIALVAGIGYAVSSVSPAQSSQQPTTATFDITIDKNAGSFFYGDLRIKQLSGDPVDTANLKLKFTVGSETTEVVPNTNNTFYIMDGYPQNVTYALVNGDKSAFFGTGGTEEQPYTDDLAHIWLTVNFQAGNHLPVYAYNGSAWIQATSTSNIVSIGPNSWGDTEYYREYTLTPRTYPTYVENFTQIRTVSSTGLQREIDVAGVNFYPDDGLTLNQGGIIGTAEYNSPWLWSMTTNPTENVSQRFGEYTLSPGITARAIGTSNLSPPTDDINSVIPNWSSLRSGDVVNVMIVSTGSGQVIWQGDVIVG